jgi:hypothetical protein
MDRSSVSSLSRCRDRESVPLMRAAWVLGLLLVPGCSPAGSPPAASSAPGAASSGTARGPRQPSPGAPIALPAEFIGDRIFVRPTMVDGRTLRLYTDSGGGTQILYEDVVKRLGLPVQDLAEGGEHLQLTPIPAWRDDASLPAPLAIHQRAAFQTSYLVLERPPMAEADDDGFLGQGWFGGRVWTFDYPARRLLWRADGDMPAHAPETELPLHLPLAPDGRPSMHFGRITIHVDGEPIDLLFDTGATLSLSAEGLAALADGGPAARATSFITRTVFDRWRSRHPDWRVVDRAESGTGFSIIQVARISIAGRDVGPVWFTSRLDHSFHEYMSGMMDARVEGALGGNALAYFRVTVDYPRGRIIFQ